ncbi:MAG: hypothetical protein ABSH09_34340 [Bryobacteraceae bacterium]
MFIDIRKGSKPVYLEFENEIVVIEGGRETGQIGGREIGQGQSDFILRLSQCALVLASVFTRQDCLSQVDNSPRTATSLKAWTTVKIAKP